MAKEGTVVLQGAFKPQVISPNDVCIDSSAISAKLP